MNTNKFAKTIYKKINNTNPKFWRNYHVRGSVKRDFAQSQQSSKFCNRWNRNGRFAMYLENANVALWFDKWNLELLSSSAHLQRGGRNPTEGAKKSRSLPDGNSLFDRKINKNVKKCIFFAFFLRYWQVLTVWYSNFAAEIEKITLFFHFYGVSDTKCPSDVLILQRK